MEKENTFLNADNLYEEVEGEAGKELALEIEQKTNLVGIIKSRFTVAEDARRSDESRWLRHPTFEYRLLHEGSATCRPGSREPATPSHPAEHNALRSIRR